LADKVLHAHVWGMRVIYWLGTLITLAGGALLTMILQASWDNNRAMGALTQTVDNAEETVEALTNVLEEYREDSIQIRRMAENNQTHIALIEKRQDDQEENLEIVRKKIMILEVGKKVID